MRPLQPPIDALLPRIIPTRSETMKHYRSVLHSLVLSTAFALSGVSTVQSSWAQELFVGDIANNGYNSAVAHFDASNGTFLGDFVPPNGAGLHGPEGMIFTSGELVVVNQNVFLPISGEVLRYDGKTGTFIGKLVASSDPNAPFAPRGIVRGGPDNLFYVADNGMANGCPTQGDVKVYNADGAFLYNLDRHQFSPQFFPRGVVFGPDGFLYVSVMGCPDPADPTFDRSAGYVLRFDVHKKAFVDVFASTTTVSDLHRPEGLVFDRDGNLWVTSFRLSASDSDKILKLNGKTGALLDELVESVPGAPRAYAHAILFGPEGELFMPIMGGDSTTSGQVRRCNTKTKQCDIIVPANSAGGALQAPVYLIFRNSNPATLNYESNSQN
jgi:sugar lactone lactonase YvrE